MIEKDKKHRAVEFGMTSPAEDGFANRLIKGTILTINKLFHGRNF